jgi:hypothetical protein
MFPAPEAVHDNSVSPGKRLLRVALVGHEPHLRLLQGALVGHEPHLHSQTKQF